MVKVGVIGCGAMGRDHIRRLAEVITETKVVAVADAYQEIGQKTADQYGVKYYKEGEALIQDPEVEAVLVCSSDPTHKQYVLACIKAGKYVLCEKPLGVTAKECKDIVDAEIAGGKKLVQVGFMRRYDPGYAALKAIIKSGEIGAPLMIHACHRNLSHVSEHTSDMTICNSGIHEIDICRWLLEEDYQSGQVLTVKQNSNTKEGLLDPQIMLLQTKSGVRIDVEVNMSSGYGYDIQCEIVGEKGVAKLPDPSSVQMKSSCQRSYRIDADWTTRFIEAYDIEVRDWAKAIQNSGPTGPTSWDGYIACMVGDLLVSSRKEKKELEFALPGVPEFYTL